MHLFSLLLIIHLLPFHCRIILPKFHQVGYDAIEQNLPCLCGFDVWTIVGIVHVDRCLPLGHSANVLGHYKAEVWSTDSDGGDRYDTFVI